MFSSRAPANLEPNAFSRALDDLRRQGTPLVDLTLSNPTRADIPYPSTLLSALASPDGLVYAPSARGARTARHAVATDFARRGITVSADDLLLTASTSEAYSLAFKVLCDPGDEVLVPRPSYPLFEHLTRWDAVTAVPYHLEYHGRWSIDFDSLTSALTARTRAVLIVSPNNPTGSYVTAAELATLAAICAPRHIAIICDEVFADYPLGGGDVRWARLHDEADVLGITLGGLSKSIGLPQVKLAWMALSGPRIVVDETRARLELAADTYLSVSTPVQVAAEALLRDGASVRRAIQQRVAHNYARLPVMLASAPACRCLAADAGWYAVIQVPAVVPEEELTLQLLRDDHVVVHPGYFFDFTREAYLVVSLLARESDLEHGVAAISRRFQESHDARA